MSTRALSPLKTELLGLKRKHARDEVKLNDIRTDYYAGRTFFPPDGFVSMNIRWNHPMDRLEAKQDRRERRMREIEAKLKRDTKPA